MPKNVNTKLQIKIGADDTKAARVFKRLRGNLKKMKMASASMRTSAAGLSSTFMRLGVVGAAVGASVFLLANKTAKLGDNAAKTAAKLGINIEALQELRFAAERSGMAAAGMDKSIEFLSRRTSEAANGFGTAVRAFEQLNVNAKELQQLTPEKQMEVIADRLQGVTNQTDKARIAYEIFGRQGVSMLNVFKDGAQGLAELRKEAQKVGFVLGKDAAKDAEIYTDALLDMSLSFEGLRNIIGVKLMPIFTRSFKKIQKLMLDNRENIERFGEALAKMTANGLEKMITKLPDFIDSLIKLKDTISEGIDNFGGYKNILVAIAAVKLLPVAAALVQLTTALIGLSAPLAMPLLIKALPALKTGLIALKGITLGFAAGMAAIGAAIYYVVSQWDRLSAAFKSDGFMGVFMTMVSDALTGIVKIARFLKSNSIVGGLIPDIGINQMEQLANSFDLGGAIVEAEKNKNGKSEVAIKFDNLPAGATVTEKGTAVTSLNLGSSGSW